MRRVIGSGLRYKAIPEETVDLQFSPRAASAIVDTSRPQVHVPEWGDAFFKWYWYALAITAAIHLASGVATTVIIYTTHSDWPTRVCASYSVWSSVHPEFPCTEVHQLWNTTDGKYSATNVSGSTPVPNPCVRYTRWKHVGSVDPSWMVAAFFYLSFVFQALPLMRPEWCTHINYDVYRRWLSMGVQPLRFIEYSVSSTLMILVIALLNGVTDLWLLLALAAANWCCMMFGLFHEQLTRLRTERMELGTNFFEHMGAHLAGWVPFAAVWTVLTSQFEWSLASMIKVPTVVKTIPPVQLFMFSLFGINQMMGTLAQHASTAIPSRLAALRMGGEPPPPPPPRRRWSYMCSEVAYTVLSLTAKSLLAWTLLGGNLQQDPKKVVSVSLCA